MRTFLAFALTLGLTHATSAATFCVSTASELQTALTTAASNGEDDDIQIVQGTYVGNFVFVSSEWSYLTVEGGYTANCASRVVDPSNTTLDGNSSGIVLQLDANNWVYFVVDGLTVINGSNSTNGGGLHISTDSGNVTLSNSIIRGNTSNSRGGGVYIQGANTASLTNNTFTGNTAGNGGGVSFPSSSTATLANNTFTGNKANSSGGGVYFGSSSTATLTNNTITGNTAKFDGGGVSFSSSTAILTDNTITANKANYSGGGVYFRYGTATLTNNTIANNLAKSNGGGIWLGLSDDTDTAYIYNNIIWNNSVTAQANDLYLSNDDNNNSVPSPVEIFNNNFSQSANGFSITIPIVIDPSNLNNLNPLFVDADNGDYHLQAGSPCIEAGDNAAPSIPTTIISTKCSTKGALSMKKLTTFLLNPTPILMAMDLMTALWIYPRHQEP